MRALLWILLGLVIGAFAAISVANALQAGSAVHKGVMHLMKYHVGEARKVLTADSCKAAPTGHFEALAILSRDISPVYQPIGERDELFGQYAEKLVSVTASAPGAAQDCATGKEQLGLINERCSACHRDFK
ncbi:MAG: hypothetical protein KDJ14_09995 [Xanthomonadales bacterium]|nr:hypothetical protein [Xanthomonadales bacterium]